MVFKVSGLFNQLKFKLGLGAPELSQTITSLDDSPISHSTPERSAKLQQPPLQSSREPTERRIEPTETAYADALPKHSQAKRSSRRSKAEMPKRQRWRRSAVRAAKKAHGFGKAIEPNPGKNMHRQHLVRYRCSAGGKQTGSNRPIYGR